MAERWEYAASVEVIAVEMYRRPEWLFRVTLADEQGRERKVERHGAAAQTIIVALNKARLDVVSMERRIIERLVADGDLAAGAIMGVPD